MKNGLRNKTIVYVCVISGMILAGNACNEDEKVPSCEESIDSFYDADCVIVYNGDPVSENEAEDGCEDLKDDAEDESCMKEFNTLAKCLDSAEDDNDCNDCDREMEDVFDCID